MIPFAITLLAAGVFLSAFFSGNETGFYRASRVRVVMAGLDGDRISRSMLRLINNPTWFVATTLIGNNVANYVTSLAIVLLTRSVSSSSAAEMLMPIFMSPLLFVYGELLPKNLFYQAPNFLLRFCAPLFLFFTVLFAPAAAVLWAMGKLLEQFIGQSPERIRLTLARKELQQVLQEGLEAGILHPTQRKLAQSFFLVASKPVSEFCSPIRSLETVKETATLKEVLSLAKRKKLSDIPVYRDRSNQVIGHVRTIDLLFTRVTTKSSAIATMSTPIHALDVIRPLTEILESELFGEAIMQMQSNRETLTQIVNSEGKLIGVLSIDQLTNPLLEGSLGSLRR